MLVLNYEGSYSTEIPSLCTQSGVTSEGNTIIWERASRDSYNLHRISKNGIPDGCTQGELCEHDMSNFVLPITIDKTEYLAVSCQVCSSIRLIDLQDTSREPIMAYIGVYGEIGPMCHGQNGTMYTMEILGSKISILDCSTTEFKLKAMVYNAENMDAWHMTYISTSDLIVQSSWDNSSICAMSSHGQMVWKISGILDNKKISPRGLLQIPGKDLLLVGDYGNNRLLLLSGSTGQWLQTLHMQEMWSIDELHAAENRIVVHHRSVLACVKLSYYTVSFNY